MDILDDHGIDGGADAAVCVARRPSGPGRGIRLQASRIPTVSAALSGNGQDARRRGRARSRPAADQGMGVRRPDVRRIGRAVLTPVSWRSAKRLDASRSGPRVAGKLVRRVSVADRRRWFVARESDGHRESRDRVAVAAEYVTPQYTITAARERDIGLLAAIELAAATLLTGHAPDSVRDVPWNRPFYARLGFEVVPSSELSHALRAVVEDERRRGLDPSRRVVMRKRCAARD